MFNRPDEINELLESISSQDFAGVFEVVIVEDGSTDSSEHMVSAHADQLDIAYYKKQNTGPGDSRNFGMKKAKGNYFIILDSDCLLPRHYLSEVNRELQNDFIDCYGGPDTAHVSFSAVQKAINHTMTSFLTTGGIRGGKKSVNQFQPRSFNMGISKNAFGGTGGFGKIHPGEDPDLTFRIWKAGYRTRLFSKAFVYHKRRMDWGRFYAQVKKFGKVRPILNKWHPSTKKITYWFPTLFTTGFFVSMVLGVLGYTWPLLVYALYSTMIMVDALVKTRSLWVSINAVFAAWVQFFGYGWGFLISSMLINFSGKDLERLFPELFFKNR